MVGLLVNNTNNGGGGEAKRFLKRSLDYAMNAANTGKR